MFKNCFKEIFSKIYYIMNIPECISKNYELTFEINLLINLFIGNPTASLVNKLIMKKTKYGIDTHSFAFWYFNYEF